MALAVSGSVLPSGRASEIRVDIPNQTSHVIDRVRLIFNTIYSSKTYFVSPLAATLSPENLLTLNAMPDIL
jgi:hypothetical protein